MAENEARFTARGIESEADVEHIVDELDGLEGVMGTRIDPDTGETTVRYDVDVLSEERVEITVRELGYEVDEG